MLAQTQQKTASSLTEVAWLGKQLPVKNERLRVSLVKLQQMVGDALRWGGGGGGGGEQLRLYEALLMECQDAMQIVRDEINELVRGVLCVHMCIVRVCVCVCVCVFVHVHVCVCVHVCMHDEIKELVKRSIHIHDLST